MGCSCCTTRLDTIPVQKPGAAVLPPMHWGSMGPPDVQLMNLQGEGEQLTAEIEALEAETNVFEKRSKDYCLSASSLKGELFVSKRILDSIASDLAKYKAEIQTYEEKKSQRETIEEVWQKFVASHNDEFISDLQTIENVEKYRQQFDRKILEPKGNEERLQNEAAILNLKWETAVVSVKGLLGKVEKLKIAFPMEIERVRMISSQSDSVDSVRDKSKDEVSILGSSIVQLSQSCTRHMQLIKSLSADQCFVSEMQLIIDFMESECPTLRREIEDFLISVPFTVDPGQIIYSDEVMHLPVKKELESSKLELVEEVEETVNVVYEEEAVLAAEQEEEEAVRMDTGFSEHNMSRMSSEATIREAITLSAYEAFDLFENAITEAPANHLPSDCVKLYIASKRWEPVLYDTWLESVRSDCSEDLPYASIILSLLQQTPDPLSRDAVILFPGVIRACNRLVRSVELDAALDTHALGDMTMTEENEKTLHTGGMMYWGDCINLVYANFTRKVGTLILKSLKPESMALPDYVTFQICHKMYSQRTDGMRVFQLLDHSKSGKLSASEFSKGLLDLLNLWTEPEDISFTFKSIYNRWSELVSKSQFSKQVNLAEYLQKTKREMAVVSKYCFLRSVLSACHSIMQQSVSALESLYSTDIEGKVLTDAEILTCLRTAGEVTISPRTDICHKAWKAVAKEYYETESPRLTRNQAKQLLLDALCR